MCSQREKKNCSCFKSFQHRGIEFRPRRCLFFFLAATSTSTRSVGGGGLGGRRRSSATTARIECTKFLFQIFNTGTDKIADLFSTCKEYERRHGLHSDPSRRLFVLVHIHFNEMNVSKRGGQFRKHRSNHLTRSAPRRGKIYGHQLVLAKTLLKFGKCRHKGGHWSFVAVWLCSLCLTRNIKKKRQKNILMASKRTWRTTIRERRPKAKLHKPPQT